MSIPTFEYASPNEEGTAAPTASELAELRKAGITRISATVIREHRANKDPELVRLKKRLAKLEGKITSRK